jgi:hypothetical protein
LVKRVQYQNSRLVKYVLHVMSMAKSSGKVKKIEV